MGGEPATNDGADVGQGVDDEEGDAEVLDVNTVTGEEELGDPGDEEIPDWHQ